MPDLVLKALEYGVLGLCAIALVLIVGIIRAEQRREGQSRKDVFRASYAFMAFCVVLALVNGYVQLQEHRMEIDEAKYQALKKELHDTQATVEEASRTITDYRSTLAGLDGLINLKVKDEITNNTTSPALRALAQQLKDRMDQAREQGLLGQ